MIALLSYSTKSLQQTKSKLEEHSLLLSSHPKIDFSIRQYQLSHRQARCFKRYVTALQMWISDVRQKRFFIPTAKRRCWETVSAFVEPINEYSCNFLHLCCVIRFGDLRESCWRQKFLLITAPDANGRWGRACFLAAIFKSSDKSLSNTFQVWSGFAKTAPCFAVSGLIISQKLVKNDTSSLLTLIVTAASLSVKNATHGRTHG